MASISDPAFAPPAEPPFPPGTSPFRQKGNGYLGDFRYYDAVLPGGRRRLFAELGAGSLRRFFEQTFHPSEWYDAYPGALIEATAARLRGLSFEQHRRQTGRWHAEDSIKGVYGALLRLVSNENIALWAPRISSLYFEFGKTGTRVVGPREVRGVRTGVPGELAQWIVYASAEFSEGVLRRVGSKAGRVEILEVEPDGRAHGRDLVRTHLRMIW